jgi:type VI secretion system (T6SS) phospholipase Tle1-like effector
MANKEADTGDTNVARLDCNKQVAKFIKSPAATDGTVQQVFYHSGVGAEGDLAQRILGGAIGLGLKQIIKEAYEYVVQHYAEHDEIYLWGFSRGSYAARALAGLIGASGIQRRIDDQLFELAWQHYRVGPQARQHPETASGGDKTTIEQFRAARENFHGTRTIKCVAVWDTVGSYGIPAGFGLAALARYFTLFTLGFHDTSFGDHIEVGLHALGIDEHRRPFVPTFWTIAKGLKPQGHVEQTWFAGAHCNVGGGYPDSGLSDMALIWMIARVQALTKLEFDVAAIKAHTAANVGGSVIDSTKGWWLDHILPHYRTVLSPDAICHGYLFNSRNAKEEHINERVHWSVIEKHRDVAAYNPPNLPPNVPADRIAATTGEEQALL